MPKVSERVVYRYISADKLSIISFSLKIFNRLVFTSYGWQCAKSDIPISLTAWILASFYRTFSGFHFVEEQ